MKNIIHILLICFFLPSIATGKNTRNIPLPFEQDDFIFVDNKKGQTVLHSEKYNLVFKSDTNCPSVPYIGINVLVSPSEDYSSVKLLGEEIIAGEDIELAPNPHFVCFN